MKNAVKRRIELIVWFALMLFVWGVFFLSGGLAHAAVEPPILSVCWDAPTQRIDGTPLLPEEIAGYQVEHTKGGDVATYDVPGAQTTFDQTVTQYGNHCYRVRVFDTGGLDSFWTDPVCKVVNARPARVQFRQCEG
jgi:hypothetical protein